MGKEPKIDLSEIKDRQAGGDDPEKPKRRRRKKKEVEIEPPPPMFSKENVAPISNGLLQIASALLKFKIIVEPEEADLLNDAVADCGNAYFPSDKVEHIALLKLTAVLVTIGVKNVKQYRAHKKDQSSPDSGKKRIGQDLPGEEDSGKVKSE